ncbi:uncharacterized protein LOC110987314 isoform X2 [Acanthaster planci]|uniref:Uncharacterized protein LOC110987314 isoform X2 n=1 Tax=Acanthaster planci TaxID=133434 RepID=A0A8B7ZQD0_ACAPL|nr:uncharacterized protein LOC110987314 isoform X2 [Acanthaster planci]
METTMTDVEDQIGVMHSPTADLDVPRLKVKGLSEELAETKAKLATTQAELVRTEALRTEAEECSVKLRKKVEKLSQELEDLHKAAKTSISDVSCQTDPVASDVSSTEGTVAGSTGPSDWVTEVGTSGQSASQSVADSVRAAAEAATTRTGFVLDQTSGMYYDCNSGFYYDQVNKLYYDPSNGIYYYFDEGTGSYQFHSQVELPTAAQYGQGRRGKGRGNAWGKRKDRRLGEESREIDRRESLEDMDCQIIEIGQDTRHGYKRRRRDATENQMRGSSERVDNDAPRRAHRERRHRRERHSHGRGDIGDGEATSEQHTHELKKRMQSLERRRKQRRKSQSRRRRKKSRDRGRRDEEYDGRYPSGLQDQESVEGLSDGEIRNDEGLDMDGLEGGSSQSRKNHRTTDENRNQFVENEGAGNSPDRGLGETDAAGSGKQKDETSPETVGGSSENSTAKDDSPLGEEGKADEGEAQGQGSAEEAAEVRSHCQVIVPNPEAEPRRGGAKEQPNGSEGGFGGEIHKGYSDGEIIEDVMIVEDGEEPIVLSSDEMEEGELSDSLSEVSSSEGSSLDSSSATSEDGLEEISVDSDSSSGLEVLKVDYPPCIRMIVTKSDTLKPGSLFIITCAGGTIGREGSNHALLIQSVKVSKRHAHIIYDAQERQYTIVDLGSQNGTLLNGKAISEQRVVSEPHPLSHRDYITIGGTTLRLHIHPGDETCEECEPGQVQALIAQQQLNEMSAGTTSGSRPEKEQQRRKELRHLKKKYNLAKDDYSNVDPSLINPAYADRAGERRRAVGSDNPYQPDDQPASVDRAIESSNVGHKMLSKMGWTEGQSLGKGDRGIKEPIQAVVHSRNAGLGSRVVQSMDQVQYARRRNDNWDKARGRFNLTDPQQSAAANRGKKAPTWVQGGTEKLDASPQHSTADDPSSGNAFGMVQLPLAERGKADGRRRTSQGIVDIWDNSMDAGRTSWLGSSKGMEETIHSRDQQHSRDSQEKQRDDSTEYERLFLGDRAQSGNLEGATEALGAPFTADSSFKNVQLTEGSHDESKRTRQPPRGVEDRLLHSSTSTVDTDAGRVSEQIIPADSSCVGLEESNTAESSVKKTVSDGESSLTASVDSTDETSTNTPQLPTPREMRVDREQNTGGPENIDKAVQSGSLPSRISDENLEASAKKTDVKNGEQPKSVVQPSQEGTEKAKKIQLKWSKGGKEKLATSLVAFEESESDGENGDDLAGNSKSVEQEQVQQPQGEEHRASRSRRGSNKPSRWSSSRNSSGN